MLYDFQVPYIKDSKNIKDTFASKSYVSKDSLKKLSEIAQTRDRFKSAMKDLVNPKHKDPSNDYIHDIHYYADSVLALENIFDKDYAIKKNWKWTPLFTKAKVLKFGKKIDYGKSGEIIMTQYAYFTSILKQTEQEVNFIKNNCFYIPFDNTTDNQVLLQKDPTIVRLRDCIQKVLKIHVKAWLFLSKRLEACSPSFDSLAFYNDEYIEAKKSGIEIALGCTKINANILHIEFLRRQEDYEEMGKYAKTIVLEARNIVELIKPYGACIDQNLVDFVTICEKLYMAIAIWSLLVSSLQKLKTQIQGPLSLRELNNRVAACVTFVKEISRLHKEILEIPNISEKPCYAAVVHYFTRVFKLKVSEVPDKWMDKYKFITYQQSHFMELEEKDYIKGASGRDSVRAAFSNITWDARFN